MANIQTEQLYTVRWYINNKFIAPNEQDKTDCLKLLASLLGETVPDPAPQVPSEERPNANKDVGKKLLYYPIALKEGLTPMKTNGEYRKAYPEGLVVHWTSGHWDGSIKDQVANASPYCYFVIDNKGQVAQAFPLNRWGSHAGSSYYKPLGSDVSKFLVGCEVMCAGDLTKKGDRYMSWFNREVPADQVVFSAKRENIHEGYYQKYTKEQFDSLVGLCLWLKANNPDVFSFDNVVGHDEIAPTRKSDPGASLVNSTTNAIMTISEFREFLKLQYKAKYVLP